MSKVILGLLVVIFVAVQAAGCHVDASSSTPLVSESALPPVSSLSATEQATSAYVPPVVSTPATMSPSLALPSAPTAATLEPGNSSIEPLPTTTATQTTIEEPQLVVIEPPAGADMLIVSDSQNDLFDNQGQSIQAEAYLDIVVAEAYTDEAGSFFRIKLGSAIPPYGDIGADMVEWGFFIDADMSSATGWAGDLVTNDIGADYFIRMVATSDWVSADIHNASTDQVSPVAYELDGDTISLYIPASVLALEQFDFTVATHKWQSGKVVAADKAPNQGHYNMPNGYVYIKSGLPTLRLTTAHAIVWYNEGNEARAQRCAEDFEEAFTDIIQILKPPTPLLMTIFVYATRDDMVTGLQSYSALSEDEALRYQNRGAPRPTNNITHIPPDFDWRDIYHQQVLGTLDRLC
ncbi:MAG: hypothetical protein FWH51_00100 [Dehalococcoidia bacterium]|nr:hypothetical protein [Dehalococcoidia bacterium]